MAGRVRRAERCKRAGCGAIAAKPGGLCLDHEFAEERKRAGLVENAAAVIFAPDSMEQARLDRLLALAKEHGAVVFLIDRRVEQ